MAVTLNLNAASNTTSTVNIDLQGDGSVFELTPTDALTLNGAFGFTLVTITQLAVSLTMPAGTTLTGSIALPVSITAGGEAPQIMINNISGGAQVSWPTKRGPVSQQLTPGTWMHLDGYIGEANG